MIKRDIYVIKSSGERELFSEDKFRRSLQRVQTSPDLIDDVVHRLRNELTNDMPTSEIYRRAFAMLKRHRRSLAARYSLKKAIMDMGPTGYPFEKLVGEILKSQGFSVEVSQTVQGACVAHEVDVVATKEKRHIMVECKFHNEPGMKSDIKIALYVKARFEDIEKAWESSNGHSNHFEEAWLITNTKFTSDALQYSHCVGMKAIDWNYPQGESLAELIEKANLQPVTSLTSLTKFQKKQLLSGGIILCRELLSNPAILSSIVTDEAKATGILKETQELCSDRNVYE
jgi:Holliday junction resolvase-like predicted endonuclease